MSKPHYKLEPANRRKPSTQVAVVFDESTFAHVDRLASSLGKSKAEIVRLLTGQGLRAIQIAAQAQAEGADPETRIAEALLGALDPQADTNMILRLLDVVNDYLEAVEKRDPGRAILLASGSATALRGWADQLAKQFDTTPDELLATAGSNPRKLLDSTVSP